MIYITALAYVATVGLTLAAMAVGQCLDSRAETRRREQQKRVADVRWFTDLANEPTPIYDQLACEAIERAEGWL